MCLIDSKNSNLAITNIEGSYQDPNTTFLAKCHQHIAFMKFIEVAVFSIFNKTIVHIG